MNRSNHPASPDVGEDPLQGDRTLATNEVVRQLSAALTRPIVALISGTNETAVVACWERGTIVPEAGLEHTLRLALQIVRILSPRYRNRSIVTWLCGANPRLQGQSPGASLAQLAGLYSQDSANRLLGAAHAFVNR